MYLLNSPLQKKSIRYFDNSLCLSFNLYYLLLQGVRVYAIRALDYNTESFYRTIARKTNGFYLKLDNFDSILKFIMAISYREHGLQYLEVSMVILRHIYLLMFIKNVPSYPCNHPIE